MATRDYSDQEKIFNARTWSWPVHLIGAGGINNMVGITLAKMGVRQIHVWDDDILEARNCPTEVAYSYRMMGKPKAEAMADTIRYLMGDDVTIIQHIERVTAQTDLGSGVVICGVDSMASRKVIWQNVKEHFLDIPLFIDGRSAGEETAIFSLIPSDFEVVDKYETWLFDDDEAMQLECGARNIGYISTYMATEITRIIARFHREFPIDFYISRDFAHN